MTKGSKKSNAAEAGRPERRASTRLAADLLRFEKAFERLERGHMGLDAPAEDEPPTAPIVERDVRDYLNCLDEAIMQLAEEFAEDETIAKLAKRRERSDAATAIASAASFDEEAAPIAAPRTSKPAAMPLPRPNCNAFDASPCDATSALHAISQIDTSAV
jgi:hypothetical protein